MRVNSRHLVPLLAALVCVVALAAACTGNQERATPVPTVTAQTLTAEDASMEATQEPQEPRSLNHPVRPHFYAQDSNGQLQRAQGEPDRIVVWQGKAKVRLNNGGLFQYLDPLALNSALLGEHPAQRLLRLGDAGAAIDAEVEEMLRSAEPPGNLFHSVSFQYLQGVETSGIVSDVFPDGTFLVIVDELPEEWQSEQPDIASPTHLHVNPRALSVGRSQLAQEFEQEILSLSFDDQRYPPPELARKQCGVYHESLAAAEYGGLLEAVGYNFTPEDVNVESADGSPAFGERLLAILRQGAGEDTSYFGHDRFWLADRLDEMEVSWMTECDTAGAVRSYQKGDADEDNYYLIVRRSLEPEKTQRYRVLSLDHDGSAQELYVAPGIVLMAMPLPYDDSRWLMSAEGWKSPDDEGPADPRWQTVYLVNLADPEDYHKVQYPISQFPEAPEAGLYGVSPRLSSDGRYLLNTLYGFKNEGGGIWVSDLSMEDYYNRPDQFARIVAWDHTLSWMKLEREEDGPSSNFHLFMTGKEVADDFAMTANILRVRDAGLETSILHSERLLQMVGWNPVPFAVQRLSDTRFRVAVETHFNYESSLLPRAKGVYIVPVDLEALDSKAQP